MFESFLGVNPWTALLTLLNTLLIFFVGRKYLFGPVMSMIRQRQKEIDDLYACAGAAERNARAMEEEYRQMLSAAARTGEGMVRDAVARAHSREEEILRQANADAAAILDKASAEIAREKKKAIHDAKNQISGLALAIAGKVVERELNEADQTKFIHSFIEGLGDGV